MGAGFRKIMSKTEMKDKVLPPAQTSAAPDDIDLLQLLATLFDHRWFIGLYSLLCALAGFIYVQCVTPVYTASSLLQIESNQVSSLVSNFSKMLPGVATQPEMTTEISLITSRMVLGQTIDKLSLSTVVSPDSVPDRLMAHFSAHPSVVSIESLDVPEAWGEKPLWLTVTGPQTYTLDSREGLTLSGVTGQPVGKAHFRITVSELSAPVGRVYTVHKRAVQESLEALRQSLSVSNAPKDSEVVALSMRGTEPQKIERILNTIMDSYLRQNIARKSEQSARSLAFLDEQLPRLRAGLADAESRLNTFRKNNDSVDLSLEAKSALETLVALDTQLNELTFRESEISKLYTKDHPAYRALLEKRSTLQAERERIAKNISKMPETQQNILRLTRDVQSGQETYMLLLNKKQELSIVHASTVGNVRIIDPALTQSTPVSPRKSLVVCLAFMLGLIVTSGLVLVRNMLHRGIGRPEEIEALGLSVYATIPHSDYQYPLDYHETDSPVMTILALLMPTNITVEAIRGLRTSMHFASINSDNRIIAITGTAPGVGKSFIISNLAVVTASSGQRVLLIDGDMRRGYLHRTFCIRQGVGLSDILAGNGTAEEAIHHVDTEGGLDVICRGKVPPNPSELLMRPAFEHLLSWAQAHYDIVLLDTPPVLTVTDAALVCRLASHVFLVTRFSHTRIKEVELSAHRLTNSGIPLTGVVINGVVKNAATGDHYTGYHYDSEVGS